VSEASIRVVIVNFRTADLTAGCLRTLAAERKVHQNLCVSVVDNFSEDGSAEALQAVVQQEGWESWVQIIAHPCNDGFGAGNNVALKMELAQPEPADYLLILNPDTEVLPGAIATFLQFFEKHPEASILGPRTESTPGLTDYTAFRFPSLASSIAEGLRFGFIDRLLARRITAPAPRTTAHPIDWVSGGCMFVRREVLQTVGLFDEQYFLYFEEIDLLLRAKQAGFQTWYVPEAGIMHYAGSSTGVVNGAPNENPMPVWWFASRAHFWRKFHNPIYTLICNLSFVAGRSLWKLRNALTKRRQPDPPHFLRDFVRYHLLGQRWD